MVQFSSLVVFSLAVASVSASPLQKRIAQIIADSTQQWVKACTTAGGADKCNTISQQAFSTLLAAGKNCDQQDAADAMVDLAKTLNNNADMIRLAQIFVQQPRNAPDSLQVPYCQKAPKNAELNGFFHCQFAGSKFPQFSGDQTGNLPLGLSAVNPPGSCPAKTDGPVPDGVQLNTLVSQPGKPLGGGASSNTGGKGNGSNGSGAKGTATVSKAASATVSSQATSSASSSGNTQPAGNSKPFTLQNGLDAQKLNAQFATLTADSSCTGSDLACVGGSLGTCVGGKFTITSCSGGTQCFALPLVNKAGTSITCDTQADAAARIAETGAKGGITGN